MKEKYLALLKNVPSGIVTVAIFIILFLKVQWRDLGHVLASVNLFYFIAAVSFSLFLSALIGTDRLRLIVGALGGVKVAFAEAFLIKMGSQPLNLFPSGKLNLVSQMAYLKKYRGLPLFSGIHFIFLSLFLNFLALLLLVLIGLIMCCPTREFSVLNQFRAAFLFFAVVAWGLISLFIIIKSKKFQDILVSWIGKINPRWKNQAYDLIGLYKKISYGRMVFLLIYSMIFQYLQIGVFFLLVKSLGLSIPVLSMIIFVPAVLILSNAPLTVGGLGLRESLVLLFFSSYGGKESVLVLGMLFSFSEFIAPALFGLLFTRSYLKLLF